MYVHACAATPLALVQAMTQHGITAKLENVEVIHMHTQGDAEYAQPHCKGRYLLMLLLEIEPGQFLVLFRPGTTSVRSGLGTFFVSEPEHTKHSLCS